MTFPVYQSTVTTQSPDLADVAGKADEAYGDVAKTVNQTVDQANKYLTTTDVLNTVNKMKNQFSNNFKGQTTIDQANAAYGAYAKGVINTTPFSNRPYVVAVLAQNYSSLNSTLDAQNKSYTKAMTTVHFNNSLNTLTDSMEKNAREAALNPSDDPNKNPALAAALTDHATIVQMATGVAPILGGKVASKAIQDARDNLHMQRVLGQYQTAKLKQYQDPANNADAPKKIRDQFVSGGYDNLLRPDQLEKTNSSFNAIDNMFKQAAGLSKEHTDNLKQNVLLSTITTGKQNATDYGNVLAADPEGAEDFQTKVNAYSEVHNEIANAQESLPKLESLYNKYQLPLSDKDAMSSDAWAKNEARKAGAQQIAQIVKQAKTNPAVLSESTPIVQQQIQAIKASPAYVNETNPIKKQFILFNGTAAANVAAQKAQEIPDNQIKALDDQSSAALAYDINSAPDLSTQVSRVIETVNSFDKSVQPYVINGMKKYLPGSSQYLLKADANPQTKYLVPYLALGYSKKISDFDSTLKNHNTTLNNVTQAVINSPSYQSEMAMLQAKGGDPTPELTAFQNYAVKATLQLMDSRSLDAPTAANLVTQAQAGEATYHTFLTNGSTIKTPTDVQFVDLHNTMSYLIDKASQEGITLNPNVVAQYGQHPDTKTMEGLTLNTAKFVNNRMNNGIVLIDKDGSIVTDKNGKPIGETFDNIKSSQYQSTTVTPYLRNLAQKKLLGVKKLSDFQSILNEHASKIASNYVSLPTLIKGSLGNQDRFGPFVNPNQPNRSIGENISKEFGG